MIPFLVKLVRSHIERVKTTVEKDDDGLYMIEPSDDLVYMITHSIDLVYKFWNEVQVKRIFRSLKFE